MVIRKITEEDFEAVHQLIYQVHELHLTKRGDVFNDIDPFSKKDFDSLIVEKNIITLVAEKDNRVIGLCTVTLRPPSKNPILKSRRVAYMEDLCVDENYRGQGVGAKLFEEAKKASKEQGAQTMELMVWSFNCDAIEFYGKRGMKSRSLIMEQSL